MEREHEVEAQTESGDQADASADVDGQTDGDIVEELLIEEISIDGMCGVY